jgi:hypothetical protein
MDMKIASMEERTGMKIANMEARIDAKMAKLYLDMVKWFVCTSAAMCGALVTAMYYMIKYMPIIQQVARAD